MTGEPHVDLQALFSPLSAGGLELQCPGPGEALAVVRPRSPEGTAEVVRTLRQALIHWSVGPLDPGFVPRRHAVIVDLSRLSRVSPVQSRSSLVEAEAGVRPETLARLLRGEGFSAEPLPRNLLLGRALAGRWSRLRPPGVVGPSIGERVIALQAVLPDGSLLRTPLAPRRATGPDYAALLIGGGGGLAVVVGATLRVTGLPEQISSLAFVFPDEAAAQATARRLRQALLPLAALERRDNRLALRLEGMGSMVQGARRTVERLAAEQHGEPCPPEAGWLEPILPAVGEAGKKLDALTARLRRALDPAGLLLTRTELCGR